MPWLDAARENVGGFDLFDVHVHFGINDPGGLLATEEQALDALTLVDSGGVLFPLKEPEGYRAANERALVLARESGGRLAALARIDPVDDPRGEARRCLDGGAAGIKLHPRGEGFELADTRLDGALADVDERRGLVMLHAGPGVEELGRQTVERARQFPGARFILAHCAITDLAWIWEPAQTLSNLYFDTSWWNPSDIFALFRTVRPSQILYASDIPFSSPVLSATMTARVGIQAGLNAEQLRSVLGGQLRRLLAGEQPLDVGEVQTAAMAQHPLAERVYTTLVAAVEGLRRGEDGGQGMELARHGCAVPDNHELSGVLNAVRGLLDLAEEADTRDPLRYQRAAAWDFVLMAATAVRTAAVPPPSSNSR
jgi:predicted TIM-barrel fold metal-dependent hydrolase